MGCQEPDCPCREYRIYYPETHYLAAAIKKEIDDFRVKYGKIEPTREQELEAEVEQLKGELYKERQLAADWAVEVGVLKDRVKELEEILTLADGFKEVAPDKTKEEIVARLLAVESYYAGEIERLRKALEKISRTGPSMDDHQIAFEALQK